MSLDRSSPMPLWAQLESHLRARLDAGEFDQRFPTDLELVGQYAVSRHTVREAIRHLNKTGILRRERGRGTVVDRPEFVQPLGALYSLYQTVESTGVEQRSVVVAAQHVTDGVAADQLGLPPDSDLFFLERVRLAGSEPLAIDRVWIPMSIAAPLLNSNFERTALYDEMELRCGVRPDAGWERIAPILPTPEERQQLHLRRGQAAFFLERLGQADGRAIEWRNTLIRGDRYRFLSRFESGVAPSMVATPGADA